MQSHAEEKTPSVRSNEEARVWFRSDRVYLHAHGSWYFRTREGVEIGPYDTRFEAEIEAGLLKELLQKSASEEIRQNVVDEFIADGLEMGHDLTPMQAPRSISASR